MSKSIDSETNVVFYNTKQGIYEVRPFSEWNSSRMPVCTSKHFIHAVCKFFEEVHPNTKTNPIYQDINWAAVTERKTAEVANG